MRCCCAFVCCMAVAWAAVAVSQEISEAEWIERIERQIAEGSDLDLELRLVQACVDRQSTLVKLLLKMGASANAVDEKRQTALHHAAAHGDAVMTAALLENGADLTAVDTAGQSALHVASAHGRTTVIPLLIEHGAAKDGRDKRHRTPLHLATRAGKLETVHALIAAGATAAAEDENGRTPADLAADDTLASLLRAIAARDQNVDHQPVAGPDAVTETPPDPVLSRWPTAEQRPSTPERALVRFEWLPGKWATGFVICREPLLVATCAGITDLLPHHHVKVTTIDGRELTIARVFVHPGLLRVPPGGGHFLVRSPKAGDGVVSPAGPNFAVVQLTATDDIDLMPFPLASADELESCVDRKAVAHQIESVSLKGQATVASCHGTLRNQVLTTVATDRERFGLELVSHDLPLPEKKCGIPILLENGHLVAAQFHGVNQTFATDDPHGHLRAVTTQCLWELLSFHNLIDSVFPSAPAERFAVEHLREPDPGLPSIRRAMERLDEAASQLRRFQLRDASRNINEAAELAPEYPRVYVDRANAYLTYYLQTRSRLSVADQRRYLRYATEAADRAATLNPDDPFVSLVQATVRNNVAGAPFTHPHDANRVRREILQLCNEILGRENLTDGTKAEAYNLRAGVHTAAGAFAAARDDFAAAIQLSPDAAIYYENRARMWDLSGNRVASENDRRKARELRGR